MGPHHSALVAYVSACSLSLIFCLAQRLGPAAVLPGKVSDVVEDAFPGDPPTALNEREQLGTDGVMAVLDSLLQTQLGVFVFSNFVIACCAVLAAVTTSVFLDGLTSSEAGRLTQRLLKYLLFKVALVGMVVLPNEVQLLHWLPWLAVIGEMKMFVGLAKDRLAGLAVTPAMGLSRHVRTLCLLGFILVSNVTCLALLHKHQGGLSWAVGLLFALDLGVISVEATKAAISCVSLLMDEAVAVSALSLDCPDTLSGRAVACWDGWQAKGREKFFYQTELFADVAVHMLTLVHHLHVWLLHGMSFHLLDALLLLDTRVVVMSLLQRLRAHMSHRAATHSLDFTFPDAAEKLLMADGSECAICRDKLTAAKQLPCGHLFHLPCLRAWLQQSGHDNFSCPICRRTLCVQKAGLQGTAGTGEAFTGVLGQQRWDTAGQGPAGVMGGLSLSMSYNDLSAAGRAGGHVSMEEQLLRGVGVGFSHGESSLGDASAAQLLAAASMGSSDAEGFDALLAQALAASLQTAYMNPSTQHIQQQQQQQDQQQHDTALQDPQDAAHTGSLAAPTNAEDAGDAVSTTIRPQQPRHALNSADACCDVAASAERDQHACSGSSSSAGDAAGGQQLRRRARRTSSLPAELSNLGRCKETASCKHTARSSLCKDTAAECWAGAMGSSSCSSTAVAGHGSAGLQQQQQQQHERKQQRGSESDTSCWSDPLSDIDGASGPLPVGMPSQLHSSSGDRASPSNAVRSCCSGSKVVRRSSLSAAALGSASSSSFSRAVRHRSRQHSSSSRLAGSQRHSRSCGHLPDAHQQPHVHPLVSPQQAASAASIGCGRGGSAAAGSGAGVGSSSVLGGRAAGVLSDGLDEEGGVSVPAVELLLMQPRMPFRRRQGGRWGRRHIVVSDEQQAADK